MLTRFSSFSSVLEASPFQITQAGAISAILSSSAPMAGQRTCVSLMTQNLPFRSLPAVVKEYTRGSSSFPRTFMS